MTIHEQEGPVSFKEVTNVAYGGNLSPQEEALVKNLVQGAVHGGVVQKREQDRGGMFI